MAEHSESYDFSMRKIRSHINSLPAKDVNGGLLEGIEKTHKPYPTSVSKSELIKNMDDYIKSRK